VRVSIDKASGKPAIQQVTPFLFRRAEAAAGAGSGGVSSVFKRFFGGGKRGTYIGVPAPNSLSNLQAIYSSLNHRSSKGKGEAYCEIQVLYTQAAGLQKRQGQPDKEQLPWEGLRAVANMGVLRGAGKGERRGERYADCVPCCGSL